MSCGRRRRARPSTGSHESRCHAICPAETRPQGAPGGGWLKTRPALGQPGARRLFGVCKLACAFDAPRRACSPEAVIPRRTRKRTSTCQPTLAFASAVSGRPAQARRLFGLGLDRGARRSHTGQHRCGSSPFRVTQVHVLNVRISLSALARLFVVRFGNTGLPRLCGT
jgi:hypothetical protein